MNDRKASSFRRMFGAYMPSEWPPQMLEDTQNVRNGAGLPAFRPLTDAEREALKALKPGQMLVQGEVGPSFDEAELMMTAYREAHPDVCDHWARNIHDPHRALTPQSAPSYFEYQERTQVQATIRRVMNRQPTWADAFVGPGFTGTVTRRKKYGKD